MTMYTDTHCHLNMQEFGDDLPAVIGNAKKAGVKTFVVPGVNTRTSGIAVALSRQYPGAVYAAAGIHPYESQHLQSAAILKGLMPAVSAIGECGLDYHLYRGHTAVSKKDNQKQLLSSHLSLALTYDKPAILHCRDAFDDLFTVLDSLPSMPKGVIHCFSGGLQDVRDAVRRGLYLGIDGNITYSKHLQRLLPEVPLTSLLLETDAPYLTPVPHRGERNEPKYLTLSAKFIAGLLNIPEARLAEVTTANADTLFHFSR